MLIVIYGSTTHARGRKKKKRKSERLKTSRVVVPSPGIEPGFWEVFKLWESQMLATTPRRIDISMNRMSYDMNKGGGQEIKGKRNASIMRLKKKKKKVRKATNLTCGSVAGNWTRVLRNLLSMRISNASHYTTTDWHWHEQDEQW